MSFTVLYALFAAISLFLFNSLVLLARYARQVKEPPRDEEFEQLLTEKKAFETEFEIRKAEVEDLHKQLKTLEEKVQKTEDTLQEKLTELQALKNASTAAPQPGGSAP